MFDLYKSDVYGNGEIIWRYMNFSKFFTLINNSTLFFPSALILNEMDSYEGIIPIVIDHSIVGYEKNKFLDSVYINSWYISAYESLAMWKIFADHEGGIAIKTTVERLKAAFNLTLEPRLSSVTFTSGKVVYVDYNNEFISYNDSEDISEMNQRAFFIFKPAVFEHEKEFRLIITDTDKVFNNGDSSTFFNGINIKVDLDILIEKIVPAPNTPKWVEENIKSLLHKYGINKDIINSNTQLRVIS